MQKDNNSKSDAIGKLLEAIGPNYPYPTPEEIAAHKRRAEQRLKYQSRLWQITLLNNPL